MNSFRKIALALVAAIGMSTIIATPASAVPTVSVTVNGGSNLAATAVSALTPATVSVPADGVVDATDAVKFSLAAVVPGTTVSATSNGALIVSALGGTSSVGANSLSVNVGTGTTAEFYVFTRSTAVSSVVISVGGNVTTYYVAGLAGPAKNVVLSLPDTAATSSTIDGTVKITDIFGNNVSGGVYSVAVINGSVSGVETTDVNGLDTFTLSMPATAGTVAVGVTAAGTLLTRSVSVVSLVAELAKAKAELDAEKAARAADKAAADKVLADTKAALAAAEKSIADLTATITLLNNNIAKLRNWVTSLKSLVAKLRNK